MQIEEIVIYGKKGEKRSISPRKGQVNIITGKSRTGKSAIIDIVEYCFGRSSCKIAQGVIRETASWYGLLLEHKGEKIFVARQNPPGKQKSTDHAYIERGCVTSPKDPPTVPNTDRNGIVDSLTEFIGISPNTNFPPEGQTRKPLAANIKHALFVCFQKQNEISSDHVLFHRQAEQQRTQDIKDTLPYFLGVSREDDLALKQELDNEKRSLRLAEISLKESEMLKGNELTQATSLIEDAKDSGLLDLGIKVDDHNSKVNILKKIVSTKLENLPLEYSDNLDLLQDEILSLEKNIANKEYEIKAAEKFANEMTGFSSVMELQKGRLESIGLFHNVFQDREKCPFCSNKLSKSVPDLQSMRKILEKLEHDLQKTTKDHPILRDKIAKLNNEKQELLIILEQKRNDVDTIIKSRGPLLEIRNRQFRQVQVLARIQFWLDNVKMADESSFLRKEVEAKRKRVELLEKKLDDKNKKSRLESILNRISEKMTVWAKELELEHAKYPVRFYLPIANIMIDDDKGGFSLDEVGSGENLLGYHLITLFALHEYLLMNKRPVPAFLILDQPSQVYFPKDKSKVKEDMKNYLDEDREQILKFYNFIFEQVKEMLGEFQVIITDHADIDEPIFQKAILERWRGDNALIPKTWYSS